MNFIQKILIRAAGIKDIRIPFADNISNRFRAYLGNSRAGFQKKQSYMDEYKNWVYACVNARSEEVSNIKMRLFANDTEITKHEVLDLLSRVNDQMTRHQLFFITQAHLDLDGNAFWYLARDNDGKGKIAQIYPLQPDKVQIVAQKDNPLQVEGYVFVQDAKNKIPFSPKEILHIKTFSPTAAYPFPHRGMSVVEAAQFAVDTDNEIRAWNYNFFKNGARPDGVLKSGEDGVMAPEEYKRIKEMWAAEHQGTENSHKTAILTGGMEWVQIGKTQSELEFAGQKEINRDEILAMFRVPKTIIGLTEDVNRATAETAMYVFMARTIKPLMQHLVDQLNEFLLPEYGEQYEFRFDNPVPEDRTLVIAEYTAGVDKWLTRNEIRAREGLEPIAGGDDILVTFSSVPLTDIGTDIVTGGEVKSKKVAKKKVIAEKKKAESPAEEIVDSFIAKLPAAKAMVELTPEIKTNYIESWVKGLKVSGASLKRQTIKYFTAQEAEVQANLRQEMKGLERNEYRYKGVNDVLFDYDKSVKAAISFITPNIQEYIKRSGNQAAKLVGLDSFDESTSAIKDFTKQRATLFAEDVNNTTRTKLLDTIQSGIDNSETIEEISKRISVVYDEAKGYRADMIARTEVSASANYGARSAFEQGGIEKWEWKVVDPQDEDCKGNEGVVVKIGDPFPDGSVQPPDPHPNCECTTLPIFN